MFWSCFHCASCVFPVLLYRGTLVLGYTEAELCNHGSGYQFIHAADMLHCAENHMRSKTALLLHTVLSCSVVHGDWQTEIKNVRSHFKRTVYCMLSSSYCMLSCTFYMLSCSFYMLSSTFYMLSCTFYSQCPWGDFLNRFIPATSKKWMVS